MRATGIRLANPAAEQAQGPPVNPVEMANPDTACVVWKISLIHAAGAQNAGIARDNYVDPTGVDFGAKRTGSREADLGVFGKLVEDRLEGRCEAETFSRR